MARPETLRHGNIFPIGHSNALRAHKEFFAGMSLAAHTIQNEISRLQNSAAFLDILGIGKMTSNENLTEFITGAVMLHRAARYEAASKRSQMPQPTTENWIRYLAHSPEAYLVSDNELNAKHINNEFLEQEGSFYAVFKDFFNSPRAKPIQIGSAFTWHFLKYGAKPPGEPLP